MEFTWGPGILHPWVHRWAQSLRSLLVENQFCLGLVNRLGVCVSSRVVRMKRTSSSTLRREWPSFDLPLAATVERHRSQRSRSEKDYRIHKHSKRTHYPPQYLCQSPPLYIHPGTVTPHTVCPHWFDRETAESWLCVIWDIAVTSSHISFYLDMSVLWRYLFKC